MPRARFLALDDEHRRAILDAAFDEFSQHGFANASLNQIIRQAGISKGSMYYYFDDKQDLHTEVLRVHLDRLRDAAHIPTSPVTNADAFWAALELHAAAMMALLEASPALRALLRDALGSPVGRDSARGDTELAARAWLQDVVATGQSVGAIRADLPTDLLVAVALGMTLAMDSWMLALEPTDNDTAATLPALMSMLRSALGPSPTSRP